MAGVRVTSGKRFDQPGTQVGVQINTFGLKRLQGALSGEVMAEILLEAGQPALEDALDDWPVWTGASRDSIELVTTEVGLTHARVNLQAGGEKLINDPRNKSRTDYAPYVEFLGTATAPPNILMRAVMDNDIIIRRTIHELVAERIGSALSE